MQKIRNKIFFYTLLLVIAILLIMYLVQVPFLEALYQHNKAKDVRDIQVEMVQKFNEMDIESAYSAIWEIAKENEHIVVGKVDVDAQTELATQFQVYSIPTLVVMRKGKIVRQESGARPKEQILAMLEG